MSRPVETPQGIKMTPHPPPTVGHPLAWERLACRSLALGINSASGVRGLVVAFVSVPATHIQPR